MEWWVGEDVEGVVSLFELLSQNFCGGTEQIPKNLSHFGLRPVQVTNHVSAEYKVAASLSLG